MKLIDRIFHITDRSRARDALHDVCKKRFEAKLELAQIEREADRALADAKQLDYAAFRMTFERRLMPESAFLLSAVPAGVPPTRFDAWEFTRTAIPREFAQPQGKPTAKPTRPYPIRALYVEHSAAA